MLLWNLIIDLPERLFHSSRARVKTLSNRMLAREKKRLDPLSVNYKSERDRLSASYVQKRTNSLMEDLAVTRQAYQLFRAQGGKRAEAGECTEGRKAGR